MNYSELMLAAQELLGAQSEQEWASILARNPTLLEKETLQTLNAMAHQAEQDEMYEVCEILETAIDIITIFAMNQVESNKSQSSNPMLIIEPKFAWAIKARLHIALQNNNLLDEAIVEAQEEIEITAFLQVFASGNISEIDRLAIQLISKLQETKRFEEAYTINLFYFLPRAILAQNYIYYPAEQHRQLKELGIQTCRQSIHIARILKDKSCHAFYLSVLANSFLASGQFHEAEEAFIEALQLYRHLAEQQPDVFNQKLADTLNNLGNAQWRTRRLADAEKSFIEALRLYRDFAGREPHIFNQYVASALNGLGNTQREMRKLADAENSFKGALQIRRNLAGEEPQIFSNDLATTLNDLGNVQAERWKLPEAKISFTDALQLFRNLAEQQPHLFNQNVAMTLQNLGNVQREMRFLDEAKKSYTEALQIFQVLAEREPHIFNQDVAMTLINLGVMQSEIKDFTGAENSLVRALQLYRDLAKQDPHMFNQNVVITLNNLSSVQSNLRNLAEAENLQTEALRLSRYSAEQEPHIFNQYVASILNNLGNTQREMRKLADSENSLNESLQIRRNLAEQEPRIFNKDVAMVLLDLGNTQWNMRKLANAEDSLVEALQLYRDLAMQEPRIFTGYVATTLNDLGNVQREMQKLPNAEDSLVEALRLYRDLAKQEPHIFNQSVAITLNNLGNVHLKLRNLAEAEDLYDESLQLFRDLSLRQPDIFTPHMAMALSNLGNVQSEMGNLAAAEGSLLESLQIRQTLAERDSHIFYKDVAETLNNLGNVQWKQQKLTEAEKLFIESLQIYRDLAKQEPHIFNQNVAGTLSNLGHLHLEQSKLDEAKNDFESARRLIEDLRGKAFTIDDRNRILQEHIFVYNGLLACYIKMKDWERALEIAELGKSRSLSDLLNLKSEEFQPKAPTSDTLAIVKDLGKKYSDAIKELQQTESYERYLSEQLKQFENDIRQIENDDEKDDETRQVSLRQIIKQKQPVEQEKQKAQDKRFAEQTELKSLLLEISKYDTDFPPKAKAIDADRIIEISKNQNRTIVIFRSLRESTAVIFVFPTGELHVEEIKGFGQKELFELFRDNWLVPYLQWKDQEIKLDQWKEAIQQTLDTVYKSLIIYVHQVLKEKSASKEIMFVPNQSLALLPLHATSWKDEAGKKHYLLEEYTISYAPSVSVFKRCLENEKQRSNKTLFVTNPKGDLDSSEKEVSFIEGLHQPSRNLLRKDATKLAVISALRDDYSFTHFSCHGFYNQWNPFESGLVMSDEVIKLSEIINCNLQSNWLATLSACETGMVDFASPTDEHFGLPLGFIFAGSPSVWASLWSVSDMATSALMQKAYENLSTEEYRNKKPEALRQAQLSMLNNKDSTHPFFWAGFQHFGI